MSLFGMEAHYMYILIKLNVKKESEVSGLVIVINLANRRAKIASELKTLTVVTVTLKKTN